MHPETGTLSVFERGVFVPHASRLVPLPDVESSAAWHSQGREHLRPALVRRGLGAAPPVASGLAMGGGHV
jgi:hypothetical protein